jgi:hypothetical protein
VVTARWPRAPAHPRVWRDVKEQRACPTFAAREVLLDDGEELLRTYEASVLPSLTGDTACVEAIDALDASRSHISRVLLWRIECDTTSGMVAGKPRRQTPVATLIGS